MDCPLPQMIMVTSSRPGFTDSTNVSKKDISSNNLRKRGILESLKTLKMMRMMNVALIVFLLAMNSSPWIFSRVAAADVTTTTSSSEKVSRSQMDKQLAAAYAELRNKGVDEVGHSESAKIMRDYQLRKKKRRGLLFRKRPSDMSSILFPGTTPETYTPGEDMYMFTELVQSKKTHVPFDFYDLPVCPSPPLVNLHSYRHRHQRKNLGARLQGLELKPAPYLLKVGEKQTCKTVCNVQLSARQVRWLRKMVERQYRIHMTLDQLPVLMRSTEHNYAVRGFPVGFKAGPNYTIHHWDTSEYYLYNHLKFTISYRPAESSSQGEDDTQAAATAEQSRDYLITGFDVYPVSIRHESDGSTCEGEEDRADDDKIIEVINDPDTFLLLRTEGVSSTLAVTYSYEVEWKETPTQWADRWDVYLIGTPDDDIHFFAMVNSLMVVLFLTGAIATIMIRTLRKDITNYNELAMLEDGTEETGWKLVHGDVFRPPATAPMLLSVLVGAGAHMGTAFFIMLVCAVFKLLNPIKKGHTLTAVLVLYVLCGSVSGYVSARIYKFCDGKNWKMNTLWTATALPGTLVGIFTILNFFLGLAGASTAVSFLTLLAIFALWVCVTAPLVMLGSYFGFRADKISIPVKTNQIARFIPDQPWYSRPPWSFLLGGILPYGSVCIELFFILNALWLHQLYYVMGFLLAVLLILAATCAQVSIVMDYLQLCAEDHRWWWKSFGNCASAGLYLMGYSLWYLTSRLELVGALPVLVYVTYMGMISLCFALFCGSVGFLCALWFNRTIYGALKVD